MKKFLFLLVCIASLFSASCSKNVPPEVKSDFEALIRVEGIETELTEFILEAEIYVEDGTFVEIVVISPEEISGLSYIWEDGFEMAYKNLHCKTELGYLPDFSFSQAIYNVLGEVYKNKAASKNRSGDWIFTGESGSGEYEVITDEEGYIKNISLKEIKLDIDFEYW